MNEEFLRSQLLLGSDNLEILKNSKVAILGIGGVGSYIVETLARSAIGSFILVDNDIVAKSNINRQIIALNSTIGKNKVDVAKERILDINKNASVECYNVFYDSSFPSNIFDECDYIVDAIDTVSSKIELICKAKDKDIPIISCMGTGNKLDPMALKISDIYQTKTCPLCRIMRKELKARGIKDLKVVYSEEPPLKPLDCKNSETELSKNKKRTTIGSIPFVPSVAGIIIASHVVKDLILIKSTNSNHI